MNCTLEDIKNIIIYDPRKRFEMKTDDIFIKKENKLVNV